MRSEGTLHFEELETCITVIKVGTCDQIQKKKKKACYQTFILISRFREIGIEDKEVKHARAHARTQPQLLSYFCTDSMSLAGDQIICLLTFAVIVVYVGDVEASSHQKLIKV